MCVTADIFLFDLALSCTVWEDGLSEFIYEICQPKSQISKANPQYKLPVLAGFWELQKMP